MHVGHAPAGLAPVSMPEFLMVGERAAKYLLTQSKFDILVADNSLERYILVEAKPYDPNTSSEVDYFFANRDVFLDTSYPVRLKSAIRFSTAVAVDRISSGAGFSAGDITVLMGDDDSRDVVDYYFDGREIKVLLGGQDFARSEYGEVLSGKMRDARWTEGSWADSLQIVMMDGSIDIDEPVLQTKYLGTGGIEGNSEHEGVRKPRAWGECKNVTPAHIDQVNLVYHLNDGPIEAIDAVYDSGVELTRGNLVADVFAQEPAEHTYDYELDRALIRLGSTSAGLITADIKGDNDGGYVTSAADIASRIIANVGANPSASSVARCNDLDSSSVGIYIHSGDEVTARDASRQVMNSVWGYVTSNGVGEIVLGVMALGLRAVDREIDSTDILRMSRRIPPPSAKELSVGYSRAWTVQTEDGIAVNAEDERKAFVEQELRRTSPATDTATTDLRLNSKEFEIDTLLTEKTDAEDLRDRMFSLLKGHTSIYSVELTNRLYEIKAGNTVRISYEKWGLEGGREFFVFNASDDSATGRTTLEVWG